MTTVFYILVAFCLMFEVMNLLKVKKTAEAVKRYKGKKLEECSSTFIAWAVFNCIYLLICFVGLMSTQWIGFLALIILSFIPKRWFTWRVIDCILGILILAFVILNKYQFQIDLNSLIIKSL
ncbi:hypothetical protein [Bacteroides sp. An269]|uniref:hypothetical protein n=1 Tax=Bacteroides sp. An269 TaxID=1965613 RepID=UPI000B397CAF|nr:hypothetical protein [Bacteroides sp. An269]OUO85379.1 hypothetical protein B5F71_00680 [Bacteroides sp. An269]